MTPKRRSQMTAAAKRYKAKAIAEGRCPHCGDPCAPYFYCERRRLVHRIYVSMRRAIAAGVVKKIDNGKGRRASWKFLGREYGWPSSRASGRKGDKRLWPRMDDKPVRANSVIRTLALLIAKQHGGFVTEDQISAAYVKTRRLHSKHASP